jgi:hypothetical protein
MTWEIVFTPLNLIEGVIADPGDIVDHVVVIFGAEREVGTAWIGEAFQSLRDLYEQQEIQVQRAVNCWPSA